MAPITDHPLRYMLANELHARPFPTLTAPCRAAYLALKPSQQAANRDKEADLRHLLSLLDRFGAPHPQPDATHYFGPIGKYVLKWESHTEFVTYTIFGEGVADKPFEGSAFSFFPEDWLADAPGQRITSALIRVEIAATDEGIDEKASDFRIDSRGHLRMAVFVRPETGGRRIGRVVQRLCEIETYKTMAMLGLARAREMGPRLGELDDELSQLVAGMSHDDVRPAETLHRLLAMSAELEGLASRSSFRFGATTAYEAIVNQRVEVLREVRFKGRQTLAEFMMRRFDPAMRTVKSTERRMNGMAQRAMRAGDLLRTRVDVERSAENQALLESMDRRADLQLRLQQTVEGLSVVAISYYAVNLAVYLLTPVAERLHWSKTALAAGATLPVLLAVWGMIRRIRKRLH
jgi:uncharacterized membrane-anchored protein